MRGRACRLGGNRLRSDVIADHQAGQAQQQPERGGRKQGLLLEEAVEKHDDDAKACKALGQVSGGGVQTPRLHRRPEVKAEWHQCEYAHLIEKYDGRAFNGAIDGPGLLCRAPIDREKAFRQVSANAKTSAERILQEAIPPMNPMTW